MQTNKELLVKEVVETFVEVRAKSEVDAMQDVFKKHRVEIHQHVDGYIVEMHVISFVVEEYRRDAKIKKFLGLFMPVEHEQIYVKVKLKSEVTILQTK